MSSAARKSKEPVSQRPKLVLTSTPHVSAAFTQLQQTLHHFSPDSDFFVGLCSGLTTTCRIEMGHGNFAALRTQSIDLTQGVFAELMTGLKTSLAVTASQLRKSASAFQTIAEGSGLMWRVSLAGDLTAVVLYWQKTPISSERQSAVSSLIELAGQAARADDVSLDGEARELELVSLRQELANKAAFSRQFSDSIHQCYWIVDLESGKPVEISENFEFVWGAEKQNLFESLTGFMHNVLPQDRDRAQSSFHLNLETSIDLELRVIAPNGEIRWMWLRGYPSSGARLLLIAEDISEKKTVEETVREREAELISRARMLAVSDLASGVAHEINNPLTIIVGKAGEVKRAAREGATDVKRVHELADKIQSTSIRISEIIMSLKSLSRHEQSVMQVSSVTKLFQDLRDMTSERFRNHDVAMNIGEITGHLNIEMNATLVSQMLLNLLNNAFDAVQAETDKWVKLEIAEDDDSLYLYVTDSGPGIPIKNRSRIFDPFFTTKEPGKGTGLGLSLAASIAAHHHGMLRLDTFHPHTRFVAQIPKKQKAR